MQHNAEGIRSTTQSKARMAEVEYQVKMAQLQNNAGKKSEADLLIERFKVEDTIFDTHGVETEHFLLLKENYAEL